MKPARSPRPTRTHPPLTMLLGLALTFGGVCAQQPPSVVFRPPLLDSFAAGYSYSGQNDLTGEYLGSRFPVGRVSVHHFEFSASGRTGGPAGLRLAYGLAYALNELRIDNNALLPEWLEELSLNVGLIKVINPEWNAAVFIRPGIYGDLRHTNSKSVNVPVLITANYTRNRDLTWTFALSVNTFSRYPVLPVLGVRWQIDPDWNLSLGFPRTALTWQATDVLSLHAVISFQGGSYRIRRVFPNVGTLLDYREIRTGLGCEWKLDQSLQLSFETGFVADQRFDYHRRLLRLEGGSSAYRRWRLDGGQTPYLTLALNRSF
jgi:hypothetical protein